MLLNGIYISTINIKKRYVSYYPIFKMYLCCGVNNTTQKISQTDTKIAKQSTQPGKRKKVLQGADEF